MRLERKNGTAKQKAMKAVASNAAKEVFFVESSMLLYLKIMIIMALHPIRYWFCSLVGVTMYHQDINNT